MGFKRERRLTKIGRRTYNLGYDWRRSQEVRRGSAKPLHPGSSPGAASITVGRLAQLAERLLDVQKVGGSSPPPPTHKGRMRWFIAFALIAIANYGVFAQTVPLSSFADLFASRPEISFTVPDCLTYVPDSFSVILLQELPKAIEAWQRIPGIPPIRLVRDCFVPSFGDERNSIYWSLEQITEQDTLAEQRFSYSTDKILEEDIIVSLPAMLAKNTDLGGDLLTLDELVFNALVHEFGHSLGLADAYLITGLSDCTGWSVMLAACTLRRVYPTKKDVEALGKLYGFLRSTPSTPPGSWLRKYDLNFNDFIDDEEFFDLLDAWIRGEITDSHLYEATDVWVNQRRMSTAQRIEPSCDPKRARSVYDLNGSPLAWNHASKGIYIIDMGARWCLAAKR